MEDRGVVREPLVFRDLPVHEHFFDDVRYLAIEGMQIGKSMPEVDYPQAIREAMSCLHRIHTYADGHAHIEAALEAPFAGAFAVHGLAQRRGLQPAQKRRLQSWRAEAEKLHFAAITSLDDAKARRYRAEACVSRESRRPLQRPAALAAVADVLRAMPSSTTYHPTREEAQRGVSLVSLEAQGSHGMLIHIETRTTKSAQERGRTHVMTDKVEAMRVGRWKMMDKWDSWMRCSRPLLEAASRSRVTWLPVYIVIALDDDLEIILPEHLNALLRVRSL